MTNDFTKFFAALPNAFPADSAALTDGWKTWGAYNEKLAGLTIDTAAQATDITTRGAQETFANLRTLTRVREEPNAYVQALTEFAQAQASVAQRTFEGLTEISQKAGRDAADIAVASGDKATDVANANASAARKTATKAA